MSFSIDEIRAECSRFKIIQFGSDPNQIYLTRPGKALITVMFKTVVSDCKLHKRIVTPHVTIEAQSIPFSSRGELQQILANS